MAYCLGTGFNHYPGPYSLSKRPRTKVHTGERYCVECVMSEWRTRHPWCQARRGVEDGECSLTVGIDNNVGVRFISKGSTLRLDEIDVYSHSVKTLEVYRGILILAFA